jgi:hypothetical protein
MAIPLLAAAGAFEIAGGILSFGARRRAAAEAIAEGRRQAADAIERGRENIFRYRINLGQVIGRQRASMAAQGIDLGFGTAATIRSETDYFADRDVRTLLSLGAQGWDIYSRNREAARIGMMTDPANIPAFRF